jgi:iron complex transport system substrate-binding protein
MYVSDSGAGVERSHLAYCFLEKLQMRICSFLPSATEILFALDLGDSIAGVTFECDYPPEAVGKPVVVDTILKHGLTQEEIDRDVSDYSSHGESLYRVDLPKLEEIRPDLVVTQELCDVCAVSASHLAKTLHQLSSRPEVLALTPHTLEDVFTDIERVGAATERTTQAIDLVSYLRQRVDKIKVKTKSRQPRVACLEWLSPPFNGGHWVPEMVALTGGIDPFGKLGEDSYRMFWKQVLDADPEVILVMPCGYNLEKAVAEFRSTQLPKGWDRTSAARNGRVFAVNATAYFSRPGPRLVTGLEIMYALVQGDESMPLPEQSWTKL